MDHFEYRDDCLFAEDVAISEIIAAVGTPCYVYARATIEHHWYAFDQAFGAYPHLVCYAVKANSNLAVLNILAQLGSGFDIVSVGELERVLAAGGDPAKVVFSGVGKRRDELKRALDVGIRCFNVESETELEQLEQVAIELGKQAPVSLRVNPDVDAETHPYIATGLKENKFGISCERALTAYRHAAKSQFLKVVGIDCHIGSQLTKLAPFVDALERVIALVRQLEKQDIHINHLDLGGGLGICYLDEDAPSPAEYTAAIMKFLDHKSYEILIEPGRAVVGNAGVLITKVELLKQTEDRNFAIVDAAMNDLLRPALYSAWQEIIPVQRHNIGQLDYYDVVGPVCETGDFIGKNRQLNIKTDDLLAIRSAGAYGFVMSSNYNSRPRAAEVMVDGDQFHIVRQRETVADLYAGEKILS